MRRKLTTRSNKKYIIIIGILIALLVVFGFSSLSNKEEERFINVDKVVTIKEAEAEEPTEHIASWYDYALGETDQRCTKEREPCYSQRADTCAVRNYPRGTKLKVSYNKNNINASVVCRVNDYGPEEWTGRDIDLSSYAFAKLAPLKWGLIMVTIEEVK